MILPNMTYEEMISSFERDEDVVGRAVLNFADQFGGLCRKSRRFPVTSVREYRSSHGECNDYYFFFLAEKRSQWNCPCLCAMCRYSTPEGEGVLVRNNICRDGAFGGIITPHYDFLSPHFLKRYAERRLGNLMLPEKEVLKAFLNSEDKVLIQTRGASGFVSATGRNAGKEDIMVTPLSDGAAIVQKKSPLFTVYVTYLSNEQLKDEQKAFIERHTSLADTLNPVPARGGKPNSFRITMAFDGEVLEQKDIEVKDTLEGLDHLRFLSAEYVRLRNDLPETVPYSDIRIVKELEEGLSEDLMTWKCRDGVTLSLSKI